MAENPKRRWQFSLRTLLIVVTLAALPCAWVGYSLNWIRERHIFVERTHCRVINQGNLCLPPAQAPGLLWLFEEIGFDLVLCKDSEIDEAKRLFPESSVSEDHGDPFQ